MKNAARERRLTLMIMICASSSSLAFQVLLLQVTMAKKDAESDYPGPACEQFELSRRLLRNWTATENPAELYRLDRHPAITNKLVLELLGFESSLAVVGRWIAGIYGQEISDAYLKAISSSLRRLKDARAKLLKDKKTEKIEELGQTVFNFPSSSLPSARSESRVDTRSACSSLNLQGGGEVESPVLSKIEDSAFSGSLISKLSNEISELQDKLAQEVALREDLESTLDLFKKRLHALRVKYLRHEKHHEAIRSQNEELQTLATDLNQQVSASQDKSAEMSVKLRTERRRLSREKQRRSSLEESATFSETGYKSRVQQLSGAARDLDDKLCMALSELEPLPFETKVDGKYGDEVRLCCYSLLSKNVGVWNVGPVIRAVTKMVGVKVQELPSVGLLSRMLIELKAAGSLQVADVMEDAGDISTLHSDGTSKFGKKYGSFQIATEEKTMSVGLVEMGSGTAQHALEKLKEALLDIELVSARVGKQDVAEKIIGKIKNTMSDRCIVQKKFNSLLEEYRAEVLPRVVENWAGLGVDEQASVMHMNNFFCGLHYIVGLADHAIFALHEWEKVHFPSKEYGATSLPQLRTTDECRTSRMVRSATKAFEKHGDEAAGAVADFRTFLDRTGTPTPLEEYRGNRSYVLFFNSAGVYFLRDCMMHFLQDVHGETNLLLRAVNADLAVDDLVAAARALGIFSKLVVTPLWTVLEDRSVSILDMSKRYTYLYERFITWASDASPLLDGSGRGFEGVSVDMTDTVLNSLLQPSSLDAVTLDVLQILSANFAAFTKHLIPEHLPGGHFFESSLSLASESSTVAKTNAVSERDFAQLDRLLREKPGARTIAIEGMVLYSNNRTSDWLEAKTGEQKAAIVQACRQSVDDLQVRINCCLAAFPLLL